MTKLFKRCWVSLAILIIAAAIISTLFRALTPWATQYKSEVEQHLSTLLGGPVTIKTMETSWYWFEPVIKLNQVQVFDGKKTSVKLNKLLVGINLFSSLWHWQIQPGVLFIEDLHLNIHQKEEGWKIDGFSSKEKMVFDEETLKPILSWISAQQKIILKNVSAQIKFKDGSLIPLKTLNLSIANRLGYYRVKGRAYLNELNPTRFEVLADLKLNPHSLGQISGRAYLATNQFFPEQWLKFLPQMRFQVSGGKGNIQLWTDLKNGRLTSAQATINFADLVFKDSNLKKNQFIKAFKANLALNFLKNGEWQLSGDHLGLNLNGIEWPENAFLVRHPKNTDDYFIYIKNILVQSLFSTAIAWPNSINKFLAIKPYGTLYDTQMQWKDKKITYFLTHFAKLGWLAYDKFWGVDNLSGVIHWEPSEGRFEVDSENTTINAKNQKPLQFTMINAALDWKELEQGLRVSLDRLVLSHPNLLLSAQGVADKFSKVMDGPVSLKVDFSAKDGQFWLPYIPEEYLKPKFNLWLKKDLKRIANATGELIINGNLSHFPFDKQSGDFSVKSYLSGVDLIFAPNWPITRNINAFLNINKRNLEANIENANLQGIKVDKANLVINDIGLDREILLVHTKASTDAQKASAYISASPLKEKLSILNLLKMRGPIDVDMQIEAPLYPENNQILALGDLTFNNIEVDVQHPIQNFELKQLNGTMQFDQSSVLDSNLTANFLDNPINLFIKSLRGSSQGTELRLKGPTNVSVLKEKFKLPLFDLMRGSVWLEGLLVLPNEPSALDHFHIQTSLRGLSIDLPSPLGKSRETIAPLSVDIDFKSQKAVRLKVNYNKKLHANMLLARNRASLELKKGQIVLGNPSTFEKEKPGLQVRGSLSNFELEQWKRIQKKLKGLSEEEQLPQVLNEIDLKLNSAKLYNQIYSNLAIKASKLQRGEWAIQINQEKIAGNLHYQPENNTISGTFEKLHFEKKNYQTLFSSSKLQPSDLPNLDLTIASLQLDNLDLGEVTLKTTVMKNLLQLNLCRIKSPFYELKAKGDWLKNGKDNDTRLQADLHLINLAKNLANWQVSPVVEAARGDIQFNGGWSGPIYDFSVAKLKGQMGIALMDGRITNLSPETEEKLGLGKLLSILSLQTIPRRLKLDFSDLSESGYSFDEFRGDFVMRNGILKTENSYIEGPVAYASMKGKLDIAKQYYDLDLKVNPHITASLPVVATIAGGPIAGIATWVASKIINQGMQKISGYTYKISGPWRQPVVQQVKILRS